MILNDIHNTKLESYSCKQLLKDSNLTFTLTLKVNICWLAHGFKDKSLRADRWIKLHKARLNRQIFMLLGHNVLIYCS